MRTMFLLMEGTEKGQGPFWGVPANNTWPESEHEEILKVRIKLKLTFLLQIEELVLFKRVKDTLAKHKELFQIEGDNKTQQINVMYVTK